MSGPPRFIGYDVRVPPENAAEHWDAIRRADYLLRTDAIHPLSVDAMVWPVPYELQDVDLFETHGYGFVGLSATPPIIAGAVTITIAVFPETWSELQRETWNKLVLTAAGREIGLESLYSTEVAVPSEAEFRLLGYDVSDWGLISGLSNCGYSSGEAVAGYRTAWAHRLNSHHLFDDIDAAEAFVKFADTRVSEHAPFYVFGIWHRTG